MMRCCSSRKSDWMEYVVCSEVAVEAANHLGEIGADDRGARRPGEFLVQAFFFGLVTLDRGGDVLVAEVDHGEYDRFLLVGDL